MGAFANKKEIASLAFRLGELDVEVRSLKTANKQLELEFTELFDKVRHQMSRMAKRGDLARTKTDDELINESIVVPDDGVDPISQSILRRRGMGRIRQ